MKFGEKLEIRLTNSTGHWYYSEPFPLEKWYTLTKFEESLEIFKENAGDILKGIVRDMEIDNTVKDFSEATLAGALRNRGYTVTKNT